MKVSKMDLDMNYYHIEMAVKITRMHERILENLQ